MNPRHLFPTRFQLIVAIAIVLIAASTIATLRGRLAASAQESEPWPSFTMVWRETANGLGPNGAKGTQLFRLEYIDRRHFRTTLLENTAVPDAVGSSWNVSGDRSVFENTRQKAQTVTNFKPGELTVPAEWLVPGRIAFLQARVGYVTSPLDSTLARLTHDETLPDGRVVREETTYRLADLIPVRRVTTVNGAEVSRDEVVEFTLGKP